MNNQAPGNNHEGYIVVHVTTARGAIPLADASVQITGTTPETSGVIYSLITNADGQTQKVALPAPDKALGQKPGDEKTYATYNIEITKPGFIPLLFHNVPIYDTITSIQPAIMLPAVENQGTVYPPNHIIYYEYQNPYI